MQSDHPTLPVVETVLSGLVLNVDRGDVDRGDVDRRDIGRSGCEESLWATWFLEGLGAQVICARGRARIVGDPLVGHGLPPGVLELAGGYLLAGATLAAALLDEEITVERLAVARHVYLPLTVAAATGTARAASPPAPRLLGGERGAICADLGADGDEATFGRLCANSDAGSQDDSESLASAAQEWRLPVTPYRRRAVPADNPCHPVRGVPPIGQGPLGNHAEPMGAGRVVDLTAMWAGPLCTALLGGIGLEVVKVEPECRIDGLRYSPGGHLFQALNATKTRAALDLRVTQDRTAFAELVAHADIVVDNFSPRVGPNLGIDRRSLLSWQPSLLTLSMPAFPPGPHRDWTSYGTGVHALLGLGDTPDSGGWTAPVVTYPDPLAGFAGFAAAVALLVARRFGGAAGGAGCHGAEVTLAGASQPLLSVPAGRLRERLGVSPVTNREVIRSAVSPSFSSPQKRQRPSGNISGHISGDMSERNAEIAERLGTALARGLAPGQLPSLPFTRAGSGNG